LPDFLNEPMFAMSYLLRVDRTFALIRWPRWLVTGRGLRPLHLKGRSKAEDGDDLRFLVPRGMGVAQGKKLRAAPLQQGIKRRSHPLPTKAIHEAAHEGGVEQSGPRRFD
jgi:hypothetical protein